MRLDASYKISVNMTFFAACIVFTDPYIGVVTFSWKIRHVSSSRWS